MPSSTVVIEAKGGEDVRTKWTIGVIALMGFATIAVPQRAGAQLIPLKVSTDKTADMLATPPVLDASLDADQNGYPDTGVLVLGSYEELLETDFFDHFMWSYFDTYHEKIRIYDVGNVASESNLDPFTTTFWKYVVEYAGDFGNDAFLNAGWVKITIGEDGFGDEGLFEYLVISKINPWTGQIDPRYTGNPNLAVWGDWEIIHFSRATSSEGAVVPPPILPHHHTPLIDGAG